MRWVAAFLAFATTAGAAGAALAASPISDQILLRAAFTNSGPVPSGASDSLLVGVSSPNASGPLTIARYVAGEGLVRVGGGEVARFAGGGSTHVDSVRFSTAALDPLPGAAFLRQGRGDTGRPQAFDLTYVRNWPAVFSLSAGRLSLDVTPHAGLGVSNGGSQSAEAGALVQLGARLQDRVLRVIGMNGEERSRWFLFAGASGRAVGLNLLRSQAEGQELVDGAGFVSEAQAGVGFRKGFVRAAFGYTHEKTNMRSLGENSRQDDRVGLTLSIR